MAELRTSRRVVAAGAHNLAAGLPRVAQDHCLAPSRTVDAPTGGARYGRMLPGLDPLDAEVSILHRAGAPGGVCDAAAILAEAAGPDDAQGAAGWPFFGQLIAHDITADRSPVAPRADVAVLHNARTPQLNLEIVYGDGPVGNPYLFERADPARLLVEGDGWDVPRNSQGVALIGDPRDDVHLFVNRLHVALLHAHNGFVRDLRAGGTPEGDLYDAARKALAWHYQWVVVHDFLPRVAGPDLVAQVLADGGRWFRPGLGEAFLPLEFADAAYRYGHGQIRQTYRLTADGPGYPLFPDLVGFGPVSAERRLDLALMFDLPGRPPAQRAKRLDGGLPASLLGLPEQITGALTDQAYQSLAVRDLMRGSATALPSGEAVATLFGVEPLTAEEAGAQWSGRTPLWFYVLREAGHRENGERLGPVGAQIVTEVLIGLLRADGASYLSADPAWQPTIQAAGNSFGLADLLVFSDEEAGQARP